MSEPVILGACRTPIGTFGGAFKDTSSVELGRIAVQEALLRAGVRPHEVDEVILGTVLQAGLGMNPARQVALGAGLPESVPAYTVNKVCGSGLKAVMLAAQGIRCGDAHVVVAGGAENMSGAPFVLPGARWGQRLGDGTVEDHMLHEGLTDAFSGKHMGITAENLARKYGISREAQDAFAASSQSRAQAAIEGSLFADEIVPVMVPGRKGEPTRVEKDEHPRPGTTAASLGKLKPAFDPQGTVTAGNASGLNDGAAALVVASDERARALKREPLGRIVSFASVGVDPQIMGMGPVPAVKKALERAGLSAGDIDLFELNEAFAAQSLAVVQELGVPEEKVNVRGGAIALGHPIGASGARILVTLLYAMRAAKARRGVAGLCIGGGQGVAMVVERTP
jgi:acetyl-CoA C-acetyltransferase